MTNTRGLQTIFSRSMLHIILSTIPIHCFVIQRRLTPLFPLISSKLTWRELQHQHPGEKGEKCPSGSQSSRMKFPSSRMFFEKNKIWTSSFPRVESLQFSSIPSDATEDGISIGAKIPVGKKKLSWNEPSMNDLWEEFMYRLSYSFPSFTVKQPEVHSSEAFRKSWNIGLEKPIDSEQEQLPMSERIIKAAYEECVPWLLTFLLPTTAALVLQSEVPLLYSMVPEMLFLAACSMKVLTKFDKPSYPEPLLQNRDWNYVIDSMWSSQPDIDSRKKFLMGWFYNSAPFERLRREDAIRFLAWMRFGMMEEQLTSSQMNEVRQVYLRKLEKEVNGGKPLPLRGIGEKPLPCLRFNLEPLRYRHKPLIFYGIIRSARELFSAKISEFGFRYRSPKNPKKELGYWYRPPCAKNRDIITPTPLVFVHGVGGASFYFQLIERLSNEIEKDSGAAMILFDLPFVSLGISDDIPLISDQVDSICKTLDETVGSDVKSTFVGHSFGSIVLSWMVQSRPERVANCVFLDPICFQLHLSDTLFNFHMTRVDRDFNAGRNLENPFSVGGLRSLAGTELHTNHAMLRRFSWATNALWPQCLEKNGISASILLSEKDEIVPSSEIETLVIDYQRNKRKKCPRENNMSFENFLPMNDTASGGKRTFIRVQKMPGAGHGAFAFEKNHREKVVHTVLAMRRLNDIHRKKPSRTGNSFPFPFETLTIPTVPLWSGKIETNHTLHV